MLTSETTSIKTEINGKNGGWDQKTGSRWCDSTERIHYSKKVILFR